MRDTLSLFLSSEPDITVTGAYGSAEEALLHLGEPVGEECRLSEKEQAIVKSIAEAMPVSEIARTAGISSAAVHAVIKNAYEKLCSAGPSAGSNV